jgi:hypothetical protein
MCTHKRWADDPGGSTGAIPSTSSPVPATQVQAGAHPCLRHKYRLGEHCLVRHRPDAVNA